MDSKILEKMDVHIQGMHCASCEFMIENQFKKVPGVETVSVNHLSGLAHLSCTQKPTIESLQEAIAEDGYTASFEPVSRPTSCWNSAAIFLSVMIVYLVLKGSNFLPDAPGVSLHMSYGLIFVTGLVAAVSSCMAVAGGLLLTMAAKYSKAHPGLTGDQKFKPTLYFNAGRLISYTLFGGLIGLLGSTLTLSPRFNGILIALVSVVMVLLGFQLLEIFPSLRRFQPKMPKWMAHNIHSLSEEGNKAGPFLLGGLTFFLPCGFTQALQLYVLSQGNFTTGALTMLAFSLGTLPALLSLSALSSYIKGAFRDTFLKFAGAMIVILGITNVFNGMRLAGLELTFSAHPIEAVEAQVTNGKQIVKMTVNGYTYSPTHFNVKAGVPVEWQIEGQKAAGCGQVLLMPTLNISQLLSHTGTTVFTFTPKESGEIPFNCPMGMMTPGSFTVIPNTRV